MLVMYLIQRENKVKFTNVNKLTYCEPDNRADTFMCAVEPLIWLLLSVSRFYPVLILF